MKDMRTRHYKRINHEGHAEEPYKLGNHEEHEEVRSFDCSCPRRCDGFLQALHGKNKLLNHEEPLHIGRMFQSWNVVGSLRFSVSSKQGCET